MFSLQAWRLRGKWNWNEHVLMFRTDRMWKKCTSSQTTWNTFEVIIWTWWKMVIDGMNHCCFFPVGIAGYEKWHLVVAIFCSQKNKPQLFCIECNANFVGVFLYVTVSVNVLIYYFQLRLESIPGFLQFLWGIDFFFNARQRLLCHCVIESWVLPASILHFYILRLIEL